MGFFRTLINGTSPAPGEVWSVGMSFIGPNVAATHAELMAWATAAGVAINAQTGNQAINVLSSDGKIVQIRTEQRADVDDTLIQGAEYNLPAAKAGAGTPSKTLQTACCISLLTLYPGRSYRGRCYWPTWAYSGTATMQFGGTDLGNWLTGFKSIINAVVAAAITVDPAWQMIPAVRSRLLHLSTPITIYGAGSVPDTQRRRRDAVAETYSSLAA